MLIMDTYRGECDLEVELPLSLREGDGIESSTDSSNSSERSSQLSLIAHKTRDTDSEFSLENSSSIADDVGLLEGEGASYFRSHSSLFLAWSSPVPHHARPPGELLLSRESPEGQSLSCSSPSPSPPPPPPPLMTH